MKIRYAIAGLALVGSALSGCGTPSSSGSGGTGAAVTSSAVTVQQDKGEPIDVAAELAKQGFKPNTISAIQKDAGYWLMPFRATSQAGQNANGNTSCVFRMVNSIYPEKGALADYPITSNSTVKLWVRVLNSDLSIKADLRDKVAEVKFRDLTPKVLTTLSGLDLSGCVDKTLY